MSGHLGGDKPWQVNAFAGAKGARMQWYKTGMVAVAAGTLGWWVYTSRNQTDLQDDAVAKFGRHGEKAEYGESFQKGVQGPHFPTGGAPSTVTQTRGGHAGGAGS
jgi:hypothetical protein